MAEQSLPASDDKQGSIPVTRVAIIVSVALFALVALIVIVALLVASGDLSTVAPLIQVIRDLFLIFLALQGIMIILALTILIVQVARLINLLQNEIQPILTNTQETVKTAAGTVKFVSDNVTGPLVRISGFVSGAGVVLSNLGGLRRALRPTPGARPSEDKASR